MKPHPDIEPRKAALSKVLAVALARQAKLIG
jgi:hypothetical protein